jgi:SAM-dependent methyltransferase
VPQAAPIVPRAADSPAAPDGGRALADVERLVSAHYGRVAGLEQAILAALAESGRDPEHPGPDDLAPVEEFHTGGRQATADLLDRVRPGRGIRVLDLGCGIGGTCRYLAHTFGCSVVGIDLTEQFVAVARALTRRVGLADRAEFHVGSVTALPYGPASFDGATMLHVGMNVADKAALFAQVRHVLKPGAFFALYDVMRVRDGELGFPVPWATAPDASFLADRATYQRLAEQAGFEVTAARDRTALALEFLARARERAGVGGPPALGVHLVMGRDAGVKIANASAGLERGLIAPIELICRARPAGG